MNFQTFWKQLTKETSSELKFLTLARKKPFSATFHNGSIIVRPSKKPVTERPINRNEFSKVWNKATKLSLGERFIPNNYHDETFHSSYIVAMMKFIVKDNSISI